MSPSVMAWVRSMVERYGLIRGKSVLEVGSYNVNGSVRDLFHGVDRYVGLDIRPGPGVDVLADIENTRRPSLERFDVVVSTEMLEHTPHPWRAVEGMAHHLTPSGLLLLTTRAPGFGVHDHPSDFYRFTQSAVRVLLMDAGLTAAAVCDDPDPESPGVFAVAELAP